LLPLSKVADGRQEHRHIAILLPLHDSCRMLPGRRQMPARVGTVNFNQPLRSAADRADATAQRWAIPSPFPLAAGGARHHR
jgi:hypothetical protein